MVRGMEIIQFSTDAKAAAVCTRSNPGATLLLLQRNSWRFLPASVSLGAMQRTIFKLALVQMPVEGGQKEGNLNRALERINEAAAQGAGVVVLPEAMTLGWTHPSARTEADEIPNGPGCARLRDAARRNRVYVCAGLVEQ